ncbi:MAG: ABC transporter ATP-binding protein [Planctomycetota bacterium]
MSHIEPESDFASDAGSAPLVAEPGTTPSKRSSDVLLSVDGLDMVFGPKQVLHGVSFDVRRGEIFGFIGPNGAGKTTTIRILSTLLIPTRGDLWLDGIHVVEEPEVIRRRIGYMPDYVGVYPGLTVKEYLDFFAGAYRLRGKQRAMLLSDVVELTDLGSLIDTEVQVLSKGMRQRLCLAQTLIHDPDLLILDEPASGLDPRARIEFRALLKELRRLGKTILLSSHILTELSPICDSVGIIEQGHLIRHGSVADILSEMRGDRVWYEVDLVQPNDRVVGALLAHPSVRDAKLDDCLLRFGYEGSDEELHSVFAILSKEQVSFTAVRREGGDLESIFMSLTRGEVS